MKIKKVLPSAFVPRRFKELSRSSFNREFPPIRPPRHHRRHSPKSDEAEAFSC